MATSDVRKVYFSYAQIHEVIETLVPRVTAFAPDIIVAIGGGGFIPARMLRSWVRVPILAVSLELYGEGSTSAGTGAVRRLQWLDDASVDRARGKRILVVDEVDDTRATLAFCVEELIRTCTPATLAIAVVHDKAKPKRGTLPEGIAHYAGKVIAGDCWACYPWDAHVYGLTIAEHEARAAVCAAESQPQHALATTAGADPSNPPSRRAFRGNFMHAPDRASGVEVLSDALVVVGAQGEIEEIFTQTDPRKEDAAADFARSGTLLQFPPGVLILPGFVDLHVHAPQWQQAGRALDRPLEEWLHEYTFPLEARFQDPVYAADVYPQLVRSLLANGTTTAVYYGSVHLPATRILADVCLREGQRALVGKVAMDDPVLCPAYYRDASAESAIAETRSLIEYIRGMPGNGDGKGVPPRVLPVITPRFIPSCTDALLRGLGEVAKETGCHIQTHCSESDWEHGVALERFGCTDTAALAGFGLLSGRCVLAHGSFVTDADASMIAAAGAAIAHCPISNINLSGAVFPLRRLLDRGVHVGLGTDIAGGATPSLLENARMAMLVSTMLDSGLIPQVPPHQRGSPGSRIDPATALWLATAGAGEALALPGTRVGAFRPGFRFDAVAFAVTRPSSNLAVELGAAKLRGGTLAPPAPADPPMDQLQKLLYHATRDDIVGVWVDGRRVVGGQQ